MTSASLSAAARVLLLVGLTAAVATLRAPNARSLLAALALVLVLASLVRPNLRKLSRRALIGLGVVVMFVLPLLAAGHAERGLLLGTRSALALGVALTLAETLAVPEVGPALASLGVPRKLAAVVSTALSQLALLRETGERLTLARRLRGARGADFGPDVAAALLVRSAERAERMALAASLRGSDLGQSARRVALRLGDAAVLAPALAFGVALHCVP